MKEPLNSKPDQDVVTHPKRKLILFLIISGIIGAILAGFVSTLISQGWFERWAIVAQVPANAYKIVYGDRSGAYIQTTEGEILRCTDNSPDECWIPYILPDQFDARPCDRSKVAFSPLLNPPSNMTSCTYSVSLYLPGENDEIIYAIDQNGKLWRWAIIKNTATEIINLMFMLLLGGFGGLLLGTLLWVAIRISKNRKVSSKAPIFLRRHILILAVPWLCLLTLAIAQFIVFERPFQQTDPTNVAFSTVVAETIRLQRTQEAMKWQQSLITPSVGPERYNFAEHGCDAEWDAIGKDISCYETEDTTARLVRPFSLSPFSSFQSSGKALSLPTTSFQAVSGSFGVIELQEGDHFRSKIGCLDTSIACDVSFEVFLISEERGTVILGMWQTESGKPKDIDIDLSKFSGRFVRFRLQSSGENYQNSQQDAIWLMPRIENGF